MCSVAKSFSRQLLFFSSVSLLWKLCLSYLVQYPLPVEKKIPKGRQIKKDKNRRPSKGAILLLPLQCLLAARYPKRLAAALPLQHQGTRITWGTVSVSQIIWYPDVAKPKPSSLDFSKWWSSCLLPFLNSFVCCFLSVCLFCGSFVSFFLEPGYNVLKFPKCTST